MFYFIGYYHFRDRLLEDVKYLKKIPQICGLRNNPKEEYRVPDSWSGKTDIPLKEIQLIFTEGADMKPQTFRENYKKSKEAIDKFNAKTERNIYNDYIHQKVFFREIFMNKASHAPNRHTTASIFSHFLKSDTMNLSDYYFVDEIINMGMFREYGLINEFYAKNELQENLYYLMSLILSNLYPQEILLTLNENIFQILDALPHIWDKDNL